MIVCDLTISLKYRQISSSIAKICYTVVCYCNQIAHSCLTVPFNKLRLKGSSAKWRPFCISLNVLKRILCGPFVLTAAKNEINHLWAELQDIIE